MMVITYFFRKGKQVLKIAIAFMIYYWVRLKGFFVVARLSAIFSENCSEADSGRLLGSGGKFKTI